MTDTDLAPAPPRTPLDRALRGVVAVMTTPFADGVARVDEDTYARLVGRVDEAGVPEITALGNTAEVYQLDPAERRTILTATRRAVQGAVTIAGIVGPLSTAQSEIDLAAELGYDAVMLHEPLDPLATDQGIRAYLETLIGHSPLPVVLYLRTGRVTRNSTLALARGGVAGVKHAQGSPDDCAELAALVPQVTWVNGRAEAHAPASFAVGITGFTSGIAGVRPDLALAVHEACTHRPAPQLAPLMQDVRRIETLRNRARGRYNVAVLKYLLRAIGFTVGGVRPPCADLDEATRAVLDHEVLSQPGWRVA